MEEKKNCGKNYRTKMSVESSATNEPAASSKASIRRKFIPLGSCQQSAVTHENSTNIMTLGWGPQIHSIIHTCQVRKHTDAGIYELDVNLTNPPPFHSASPRIMNYNTQPYHASVRSSLTILSVSNILISELHKIVSSKKKKVKCV